MALTGNETLQVLGQDATGRPAATTEQTTTGAIAALAGGESVFTITPITTVGNGTLTAAGLVGGEILRSGPTGDYSDATVTGTAIVSALPGGYVAGTSFQVLIKNATAFTQTITAGAGVTLPTTVIVPAYCVARYLVTPSSASAVTFAHINTAPIGTGTSLTAPAITSITTVGAGVLTAAAFNSSIISRGGAQGGGAFTDLTDTAVAIIAACGNLVGKIGTSFRVWVSNTTNAVMTVGAGAGVTVSGTSIIPSGGMAQFLVTYTAAATLTMVGIGISQNQGAGISLLGSTSGEVAVVAPAIAGSNTMTLQAATDTIVGRATTDTLSNKTLVDPINQDFVTNTATFNARSTTILTTVPGLQVALTTSGTYQIHGQLRHLRRHSGC